MSIGIILTVLFILSLPAIIIFALTTYSANSNKPFDLIDQMDIPDDVKVAAKNSLTEAKERHKRVMIYDITAPYVMAFILPFVNWEANSLPKKFRKWDNEVSINGDKYPWTQNKDETGNFVYVGIKNDIPTGDTCLVWDNDAKDNIEVPAKSLAYWVGKRFHPRSLIARYVWLGIRNRASMASCDEGILVTDELKETFRSWGNPKVGLEVDGKIVTGSYLTAVGGHYQLFSFQPVSVGYQRTNYGFKINNVINDPDRLTKPAMVVAIGVSYRND